MVSVFATSWSRGTWAKAALKDSFCTSMSLRLGATESSAATGSSSVLVRVRAEATRWLTSSPRPAAAWPSWMIAVCRLSRSVWPRAWRIWSRSTGSTVCPSGMRALDASSGAPAVPGTISRNFGPKKPWGRSSTVASRWTSAYWESTRIVATALSPWLWMLTTSPTFTPAISTEAWGASESASASCASRSTL